MSKQKIPCKICNDLPKTGNHEPDQKSSMHDYKPCEAIRLIGRERVRQELDPPDGEGFGLVGDDNHKENELAWVAAVYAAPEEIGQIDLRACRDDMFVREVWPWGDQWRKEVKGHTRLRQLVIAGALIAAEIDRMIRKGATE